MSNELSRRDFVKNAATAVAAPIIVPASVLGRQDAKPPSEKITIGVIGLATELLTGQSILLDGGVFPGTM